MSEKITLQKSEISEQEQALIEILRREEEFKAFVKAYDRAVQLIIKCLKPGVDYGYPYPGADKKQLTLSGAHKLRKWHGIDIKPPKKERIYKGDELWGFEVEVEIEGRQGSVSSLGIATYTEPSMWNTDKITKEKYKKSEHFLYQMAWKRAFVKAIIIYFGISGYFVEEEYEEEGTEQKVEEKFYFIPPAKLITSHFLSPQAYEKIKMFLTVERTDEELSYFIQKIVPKRNKENLRKIALLWANLVGEEEPPKGATEKELRIFIENCRNKALQIEDFKKTWDYIQQKLKKKFENKVKETVKQVDELLEKTKELETKEGNEDDSPKRLFE